MLLGRCSVRATGTWLGARLGARLVLFKDPMMRAYCSRDLWHESEIITDRKSRFQARSVPLTDEQEIPGILERLLRENKNIAKSASHPHIIAWRTATVEMAAADTPPSRKSKGKKGHENRSQDKDYRYYNVNQGFKDNGEKGAGSKLLQQVLVHHNLVNILVIVTRWYGGSPIGSLRFRHIINSSLDSLRKGKVL